MCETSSHGKRPAEFDGDLYLQSHYEDSQGRFIFPKRCRVEKCGFPLLDQPKDDSTSDINSQTYLLLMDAIRRSSFKLPNFETLTRIHEEKIYNDKESCISDADCTKVCGNLPPLVGKELISEKDGVNSENDKNEHVPVVKDECEQPVEKVLSVSNNLGEGESKNYAEYDEDDEDERIYQARKIAKKRTLTIEFWDRTEECRQAKWDHMEEMDAKHPSREQYILSTTLKDVEHVLEPNMFPYDTPPGIEHWVLWSRRELSHYEVEDCVYDWITQYLPHVVDDSKREQ